MNKSRRNLYNIMCNNNIINNSFKIYKKRNKYESRFT